MGGGRTRRDGISDSRADRDAQTFPGIEGGGFASRRPAERHQADEVDHDQRRATVPSGDKRVRLMTWRNRGTTKKRRKPAHDRMDSDSDSKSFSLWFRADGHERWLRIHTADEADCAAVTFDRQRETAGEW